MPGFVGLELDPTHLSAELERVAERVTWTDDDLADLGALAVERVVNRTRRGLDASDQPFTDYSPYSPRYARYRDRRGRNTSSVDLTFRGEMLAALTYVVSDGGVMLHFTDERLGRIASYHNEGTRRMPQRRFLGLEEGTELHNRLLRVALMQLRNHLEAA